ncbi:contact-dependent growth inhibition system immunity protein [Rhodopirellula bahusiensis]|uniref:Uncharacterized protein n=1 Tax=Rhodopirellula bahusiensis TaxID=2014065 RepID=A0A2G1WAN8_9BACT|nr:contact-dependent growth inhibition system immunity protein [Rhodopirellula bahusiensis]PHQ36104.1 hypothetical protein CEE69_05310 [Rhodopirellula bahusiensis]
MSQTLDKTLTELEGNDWGDPTFDSHLVATVHPLRHKPIGHFTIEDLRITIGQSVGLPHLMPIAVARLESKPLAEGDFFPGDLLRNVLSLDDTFWDSHDDLLTRMLPVATSARDTTDNDAIRGKCLAFIVRWTA